MIRISPQALLPAAVVMVMAVVLSLASVSRSAVGTCGAAQAAIVNNATVELSTGEYACQLNVVGKTGVTIKAAPGATPVLKGNQANRGYPAVYVSSSSNVIMGPGLTFTNPVGDGMKVQGSSSVKITGNKFLRNGMQGLLLQATNNSSLERNEFGFNGADKTLDPHSVKGTGLHSIYWGGNSVKSVGGNITNNWIHDSLNGQAVQIGPTAENLVINHNTVQRVPLTPGAYADAATCIGLFYDYTGTRNVQVRGNVCQDAGVGVAGRLWSDVPPLGHAENNAFYRVTTPLMLVYGGRVGLTAGPNYTSLGDLQLGSDGVPAGTSPLIGKADAAYLPAVDFYGKPRTGKTIGAFEPATVVPPSITIATNLSNGQILSGSVKWNATISGGTVPKVEFYIDGVLKHTELTSPYDYGGTPDGLLDTTLLASGLHALEIRAGGATLTISVTVNNVPPPTADELPLTLVAETATTLTYGWSAPPDVYGYAFFRDDVLQSISLSATLTQYQFNKPSDTTWHRYSVVALKRGPSGDETR